MGQSLTDTDAVLPAKPAEDDVYRIVVRSLGKASPRLRNAVAAALGRSPVEVARALLQAPSVLVSGISHDKARGIAELLAGTGLSVIAEPIAAPFEGGLGDCEIALVVKDLSRLADVIASVAELCELDAAEAAKMVWESPAVLLGSISPATVEALTERFAALGAELDVTRPKEAIYDVFVGTTDESLRRLVDRAVEESGLPLLPRSPLVASGLGHDDARALWERVCRTGAPVRVVSRDFQRFDVRLLSAGSSPDLIAYLVASVGMPRAVAERVLEKTPIVLHHAVRHARAHEILEELHLLGARGAAQLVTFQTFTLVIDGIGDVASAARLLQLGAGVPPEAALRMLASLPCRTEEPLPRLRAMWLAHELKRTGARARLVLV